MAPFFLHGSHLIWYNEQNTCLGEGMKRFVSFIIIGMLLIGSVSAALPPASSACPGLTAQGAALYDPTTGEFFYEKNADGSVPAAFTVKVMTVLLAMESLKLDETIAIAEGFFDGVVYHSGLNFQTGERVTVRDLCYAVLVKSADEACNVLASPTGRTVEEFVSAMYDKAVALGMNATHFADTHGESSESYTTARDAVKLLTAFAENADLLAISDTTFYRMPATDVSEERLMYSSNLLLNAGEYGYSRAIGIKNHYSNTGGYSQGVTCDFNGMKVICAVFNTGGDAATHYGQLKAVLEWVRTGYQRITVLSAGMACGSTKVILCRNTDTVMLVSGEAFTYVVPTDYDESLIALSVDAPDQVEAPVREGDALGTITVTYDDTVIGTVPALAGQTAERDAGMTIRYRLGQFFSHPIVIILLVLAVIALAIYIAYAFVYNKRKRRRS